MQHALLSFFDSDMRDQTHDPDLSNLSENLPIIQEHTVLFGTVGKYDF